MTALATAVAIASMIAGHPTQIACDTTVINGRDTDGWTYVGSNLIHLRPELCEALGYDHLNSGFARAVETVIHEAAHARGVTSEACAEMYAHVLAYQVLRDYYHVPFFSPLSETIASRMRAQSLRAPSDYHWNPASCDTEP